MNPPLTLFLAASCFLSAMALAEEPAAHFLKGTVRDNAGTPAPGVTVFVADAATGVPLFADGTSLAKRNADNRTDLLVAVTGDEGTFDISVPAGSYRLVAQRWQPPTQPWTGSLGEFDGLPHFGPVVELFGTASGIEVPSDAATRIELRPPGSGTLTVTTNPRPGNDATLLVIGTEAPLLDPIFAFEGWRPPFLTNAIGMNRMPKGVTTFKNVPEGDIHLTAFANDNRPGFGCASANVGTGGSARVTVDLVAGWSDGRKTPPDRLRPLYDKAVANRWDLKELEPLATLIGEIEQRRGDSIVEAIERHGGMEQMIGLPDGTSAPLPDALAVWAYLRAWPPEAE